VRERAIIVAITMIGGCADAWPLGLRAPSERGTLELEWKQPTADLELIYGVGDPDRGGRVETYRRSFRIATRDRRPARLQLPLPPDNGEVWYGFNDIYQRGVLYYVLYRRYDCRPGGRLRVDLDAAKKFHQADEGELLDDEYDASRWYIDLDEAVWQEGCKVPEYALGLTPPAIATVSARWSNPAPRTRLWVYTDRRRKSLIHEHQSFSEGVPMRSGPGRLWVDFSDVAKQVWEVQSQPFACADGGRLDVQVQAAIVDDRPSIVLKTTGHDCQVTGPATSRCTSGKRHPAQHRDEADCRPELWPSDCCVAVPNRPDED
jgi:hypothetical protein